MTDASAAELGPDTATLVVSRGPGEPTIADRIVEGTRRDGEHGVDYTLSAQGLVAEGGVFEVTIPAGQTSVTVTLSPIPRWPCGRTGVGRLHG